MRNYINKINIILNSIERAGNKLPNPAMLFAVLSIVIICLSAFLSFFDISVVKSQTENEKIVIFNLLSAEGIRYLFGSVTNNMINYAPLGTVLVAFVGISLAEHSGLISAVTRLMLKNAKRVSLTVIVILAGILSNIAFDLGYLVVIPLAASIYCSIGRHPIAGLVTAFAAVSAGFSANLVLGILDPLLAGITEEAAKLIDVNIKVNASANWYFMIISTVVLTSVFTVLSIKLIEPRLGKYEQDETSLALIEENQAFLELTNAEKKGLIYAAVTVIIFILMMLLLTVPENAILRDQQTGSLIPSPFLSSMVTVILLFFALPGIVYGWKSKAFTSGESVIAALNKTFNSLGGYLVLVFFAAQFIAYFAKSNIGIIIAVKGAGLLNSLQLPAIVLVLLFILLCSFINLFIGSASAKWVMLAPIFVPMFMLLNISPELTMVAYRIGDSVTNIITPLMPYFVIIITFMQKYQPKSGIGTLISLMLPFSFAALISWGLLLVIWVFMLNLPLGPGVTSFM